MRINLVLALIVLISSSNVMAGLKTSSHVNDFVFAQTIKNIKTDLEKHIPVKLDSKIYIKLKNLYHSNENCQYEDLVKVHVLNNYATIYVDPDLVERMNSTQKEDCLYGQMNTNAKSALKKAFIKIIDKDLKISKKKEFLHVSGWMKKGVLFKKNTNLNQYKERFFDESETKTPADTFAVNLDLYLNDESFSCRRASLYDYFKNELKIATSQIADCDATELLILQSKKIRQQEELLKKLKANKVYQIHYFFAGKGKQIMSRWGHAMFRVVMCADEKNVGEHCLNDVSNNFIISFAANIDELEMDYRKGINGSYASQLFIRPLMEVVNDYTVGEYRDVTSLPMKMNQEEMERFVNKTLELFWAYRGQYYFFTNNCATEAMSLLQSSMLDHKKIQKKSIYTPIGLYKFLSKEKIINTNLLNNSEEAIYRGYFYQGISDKLNESLDYFGRKETDASAAFKKFELLGGEKRLNLYKSYFEKEKDIKKKRLILGNALRVEEKILQSLNLLFEKEIIIMLKKEAESGNEAAAQIKKAIEESLKTHTSDSFIKNGYGLPLEKELHAESIKKDQQTVEDIILKYQADLQVMLKKKLPELVNQLGHARNNKSELIYMMGKLNLKR